jgi:hypothetical protein
MFGWPVFIIFGVLEAFFAWLSWIGGRFIYRPFLILYVLLVIGFGVLIWQAIFDQGPM